MKPTENRSSNMDQHTFYEAPECRESSTRRPDVLLTTGEDSSPPGAPTTPTNINQSIGLKPCLQVALKAPLQCWALEKSNTPAKINNFLSLHSTHWALLIPMNFLTWPQAEMHPLGVINLSLISANAESTHWAYLIQKIFFACGAHPLSVRHCI